jgi:hypothetical protein
MTRNLLVRRGLLALISATTLLLAACGGGDDDDDGTTSLRVLNLTSDATSVDVLLDDVTKFEAVGLDTLTANTTPSSDTYAIKLNAAGSAQNLLSASYSLSKDKHYTGVIWGSEGSLRMATLPEDENTDAFDTTATAGNARMRVFNATSDMGALDVYLTPNTTELDATSATAANVTSGGLGGFKDIVAGSYRLRVTTASATSDADVRLDTTITLTAKEHSTLIITKAGTGGVLVNATHLVQQAASKTSMKNTKARVRLIAGLDAKGTASMTVDGTTVAGLLTSPNTNNPYKQITAGTANVVLTLNGTAVTSQRTFAAGGDYTVIAYGNATSGYESRVLADDNSLPASSKVRIRVVNASLGTAPVTMSIGYDPLISDVSIGTGSSYKVTSATTAAVLDVTATDVIYSETDVTLLGLGVYTMFVLGGETSTTTGLPVAEGRLRKDR